MRTWFITGISRGLGQALANAALAEGDMVIGTVRDGTPELATGSGKLHVITLDVADGEAAEAAVRQAFARAGKIDVVVNNAGYFWARSRRPRAPKRGVCSTSTCSRPSASFARLCRICVSSARAISSTSPR